MGLCFIPYIPRVELEKDENIIFEDEKTISLKSKRDGKITLSKEDEFGDNLDGVYWFSYDETQDSLIGYLSEKYNRLVGPYSIMDNINDEDAHLQSLEFLGTLPYWGKTEYVGDSIDYEFISFMLQEKDYLGFSDNYIQRLSDQLETLKPRVSFWNTFQLYMWLNDKARIINDAIESKQIEIFYIGHLETWREIICNDAILFPIANGLFEDFFNRVDRGEIKVICKSSHTHSNNEDMKDELPF